MTCSVLWSFSVSSDREPDGACSKPVIQEEEPLDMYFFFSSSNSVFFLRTCEMRGCIELESEA